MKTFEELKEDLLERAKKHNACQDGYRMGLNTGLTESDNR